MGFVSKKISPKEEDRICKLFLRRFRISGKSVCEELFRA